MVIIVELELPASILNAVKTTKKRLDEQDKKLPARCDTPMSLSYHPDLVVSKGTRLVVS
jgi:hypothetical protein